MKKIFLIILIILLALFAVRLLSGEDDWIYQKGEWVKHGNPSAAMPTTICR